MTIYFCGGEPSDFIPNNCDVTTNSAYYRYSFSRCALDPKSYYYSPPFASSYTNLWGSVRFRYFHSGDSYYGILLGFRFGQDNDNGIYFYRAGNAYVIQKEEGGSTSDLATSASVTSTGIVYKADFYLNYGVSGVAIIYINNSEVVRYEGDLTISGVSSFDRSIFQGGSYSSHYLSEFIVADTDTRLMSLRTLAPNAAGDANEWDSGSYTDIDEIEPSDADVIATEGVGDNFQCNLTGMPTGAYKIKAVKMIASAADDQGQMGLKIGVKTNSAVHLGTAHSLVSGWKNIEKIYYTNPETASAFTSSEIDSLQLALRTDSTTTTTTTTTV